MEKFGIQPSLELMNCWAECYHSLTTGYHIEHNVYTFICLCHILSVIYTMLQSLNSIIHTLYYIYIYIYYFANALAYCTFWLCNVWKITTFNR